MANVITAVVQMQYFLVNEALHYVIHPEKWVLGVQSMNLDTSKHGLYADSNLLLDLGTNIWLNLRKKCNELHSGNTICCKK